ncbi:unnamed protein product [Cylindrotheca closterium]|uniref:Uncharacterized protein n=1 Tax=Cylindrotheca closterium TaxID=2856 RepID=A0AAD2CJ09_9STRA|nr:unnamed protein product [Cylindrotheca closterium]
MQELLSPAKEIDDEISVSRMLRRMKRRLLLGSSYPGLETPPATTARAVRTSVNERHRSTMKELSSLEPPVSPRSEDSEGISKDLSTRSDPGPDAVLIRDGVRKLRKMKRRLFLEQLACDTAASQNVATRCLSGPAAISPMKNDMFADGIHRQLQVVTDIMANAMETNSELSSPNLSSTSLRRIKRRLFLNHLDCSDLENSSRMLIDDDSEIHQKAGSSSLDEAKAFINGGDMLSSWSDKVEHDRTLRGLPPKKAVPFIPSISLEIEQPQKDEGGWRSTSYGIG